MSKIKYILITLISFQSSILGADFKEAAKEIMGHIFNLLLDGYLIMSPRSDKAVKTAAVVDAVKHAEELFSYFSSKRSFQILNSKEEYGNFIKALLCNPDFIELLHKSANERIKESNNEIISLDTI